MSSVLIVDDDPVSRIVLRQMLSKAGNSVEEASSVDEAESMLAMQTFDLVLCDYSMPDRNGLDLLDALHESENPPHFVLLTGTADRAELGDSRVDRVSAYLTKPVSTTQLASVINDLVGVRQ